MTSLGGMVAVRRIVGIAFALSQTAGCQMSHCHLCLAPVERVDASATRLIEFECLGCGRYKMTFPHPALHVKDMYNHLQLFRVAHWVQEQNRSGVEPILTDEVIQSVSRLRPPSMATRINNFLRGAVELTEYTIGGEFAVRDPKLRVTSFCLKHQEVWPIARYWEAQGAIDTSRSPAGAAQLTAHGMLAFEERQLAQGQSTQGFVAMWFNDEVQPAFDGGIGPAIRDTGYEPLRVDLVPHEGKIDDRIIAEIRRSRFIVADFTGHRGGVYYEAGFAHGLALPVVFSCRADHMDNLHFDVRQYNTIVWKEPEDLRRQLHNRLLALFGAGPGAPDAAAVP